MGEKLEKKESYTGFDAALDEEQQMKSGKYKKPRNIMTVFFEGMKRNPSYARPEWKKLLKKVIWRKPWV